MSRENPYEDIKLSPMCLPIRRPRNYTVVQRQSPHMKVIAYLEKRYSCWKSQMDPDIYFYVLLNIKDFNVI